MLGISLIQNSMPRAPGVGVGSTAPALEKTPTLQQHLTPALHRQSPSTAGCSVLGHRQGPLGEGVEFCLEDWGTADLGKGAGSHRAGTGATGAQQRARWGAPAGEGHTADIALLLSIQPELSKVEWYLGNTGVSCGCWGIRGAGWEPSGAGSGGERLWEPHHARVFRPYPPSGADSQGLWTSNWLLKPGVMAYTYNPSTLGARGRDWKFGPSLGNLAA